MARLCLNSSQRKGGVDRVSRCIPVHGLRQTRPVSSFHEDGILEEQVAGRTREDGDGAVVDTRHLGTQKERQVAHL